MTNARFPSRSVTASCGWSYAYAQVDGGVIPLTSMYSTPITGLRFNRTLVGSSNAVAAADVIEGSKSTITLPTDPHAGSELSFIITARTASESIIWPCNEVTYPNAARSADSEACSSSTCALSLQMGSECANWLRLDPVDGLELRDRLQPPCRPGDTREGRDLHTVRHIRRRCAE